MCVYLFAPSRGQPLCLSLRNEPGCQLDENKHMDMFIWTKQKKTSLISLYLSNNFFAGTWNPKIEATK